MSLMESSSYAFDGLSLPKFNSFLAFHWRKLKQDYSPGLLQKFRRPVQFGKLHFSDVAWKIADLAKQKIGLNFRTKTQIEASNNLK